MSSTSPLSVGIIGFPDFTRRMASLIVAPRLGVKTFVAGFGEAWSMILTQRPNCIILEIGLHHSERLHGTVRTLLEQLRDRFGQEVYIVPALLSPEHLAYGGDLLFKNERDYSPSGFVDSFLAMPPGTMPNIPGLGEQVINLISLLTHEMGRRAEGRKPLPPLGMQGWVQSLADPKSRELWMKWLPRYASYTNENPIIIGETGTGKTNLAYSMHLLAGQPGDFVSITPRDFSSSELVQAELFGAVAGAYTGAVEKWGLVKKAEKGTLFIDELQSIDKELQGKLITFIENKVYRRVGSSESIEADVRFVFASNRPLYDMMQSNVLRDDFAYRLERMQLELLPLAQRRLDITAAIAYSMAKIARQRPHARKIHGVHSTAYRMLFSHRWPGNLRQLENNVAKLCEITDMKGETVIDAAAVSEIFESKLAGPPATTAEVISQAAYRLSRVALTHPLHSLSDGVDQFVEMARISALEASGGDIDGASSLIEDNRTLLTLVAENLIANAALEENK